MPSPMQERVHKAFAATGARLIRGHGKGHHLVPFFVGRLLKNFPPCQERRVGSGENGIGGGLVNAVGESGGINLPDRPDRIAQQPFGIEQIDEDNMREQVANCLRAGDVDFDVERLRVLIEPVVPSARLLLFVVEELREAHGISWDDRRHVRVPKDRVPSGLDTGIQKRMPGETVDNRRYHQQSHSL